MMGCACIIKTVYTKYKKYFILLLNQIHLL